MTWFTFLLQGSELIVRLSGVFAGILGNLYLTAWEAYVLDALNVLSHCSWLPDIRMTRKVLRNRKMQWIMRFRNLLLCKSFQISQLGLLWWLANLNTTFELLLTFLRYSWDFRFATRLWLEFVFHLLYLLLIIFSNDFPNFSVLIWFNSWLVEFLSLSILFLFFFPFSQDLSILLLFSFFLVVLKSHCFLSCITQSFKLDYFSKPLLLGNLIFVDLLDLSWMCILLLRLLQIDSSLK